MSDTTSNQIALQVVASTYNLFGAKFADGVLNAISKSSKAPLPAPRSGSMRKGVTKYPHPVAMDSVYALKDISGHHSSCIQAKKYATVGLGFIDEGDATSNTSDTQQAMEMASSLLTGRGHVMSKVDEALDPLTNFGFMNELLDACEDFMDVGTGYLEAHRDENDKIDGLSQIPAKDVWTCTYDGRVFYQYQPYGGLTQYWVPFGKANRDWILSGEGPFKGSGLKPENVSELIPFIQPSNRVKYYGYPDWLSASVDIDLLKKSKQYKADFYHNRGVLDKVLVVTGAMVESDDWTKIKNAIKSSIGGGNNFNSAAFNFSNEKAKVEVLNMGADGKTEEQFAKDVETLTQNIVSSHGVPPLLANILIPGKLGASNEFISALMTFQLLRINAYQNVFEKMLAKSLGGDEGIDGLEADDFRLRTITSQIDVASADTMGKMRSEAVDPKNKDRDLKDGVKD